MTISNPAQGINTYLNALYFNSNINDLAAILDENIHLGYIENREIKYDASGKEQVLAVYNKLFCNTTDIKVKTYNVSINENKGCLELTTKKTIENYRSVSGKSRWIFNDKSRFTFQNRGGSLKITEIIQIVNATNVLQ